MKITLRTLLSKHLQETNLIVVEERNHPESVDWFAKCLENWELSLETEDGDSEDICGNFWISYDEDSLSEHVLKADTLNLVDKYFDKVYTFYLEDTVTIEDGYFMFENNPELKVYLRKYTNIL